MRYVGRPEPDPNCPVVVRKVIDSVAHSQNMMEFVKTLGRPYTLWIDGKYLIEVSDWTMSIWQRGKCGLAEQLRYEKDNDYGNVINCRS